MSAQEVSNQSAGHLKTDSSDVDPLPPKTMLHPTHNPDEPCGSKPAWELNAPLLSNTDKYIQQRKASSHPATLTLTALCVAIFISLQAANISECNVLCPEGEFVCKLSFLFFFLYKQKLMRLDFTPFFREIQPLVLCCSFWLYCDQVSHKYHKVQKLLI